MPSSRMWVLAAMFLGAFLFGCEQKPGASGPVYTTPTAADADKLIGDLKSPSVDVRARAAMELGRQAEYAAKAVPALKKALPGEKDRLVRDSIQRSLRQLGGGR